MSKILVVGANGFVGSHLIDFLKKEHFVVGVYHTNINRLHSDVTNIPITNIFRLEKDFDYVFLVNALIITNKVISEKERNDLFVNNVVVTSSICEYFINSRIIYCSSVSVYAENKGKVEERSPVGDQNEYGISKLWAEHIIKKCSDFAIVRCSSIYGEGMAMNTILPRYMLQALKEKKISIWGDGTRCQDYVSVYDVVRYLWSAAGSHLSDTFLGVNNKSFSNAEIASIISKFTDAEVLFEKEDKSPSHYYNNNYTQQQLSYSPQIDIEKGIQSLIQWIKQF